MNLFVYSYIHAVNFLTSDEGKVNMNKQQQKQIQMVHIYLANGMIDTAAKSVSGMIRCAMSAKSKNALLQFAQQHNLVNQPDFIV